MSPERRYSEAEVSRILQKALELQRRAAGSANPGVGLDELVSAASEAGIEASAVREAALALDQPRGSDGWWGAPQSLHLETVREPAVDEQDLQNLLAQMPRIVAGPGTGFVLKGRLVWEIPSANDGTLRTPWRIQAAVQGASTRITADADLSTMLWGIHGGIIGGMGGGVGIGAGTAMAVALAAPVFAIVGIPLVLAGSWALARAVTRATYQSARARGLAHLDEMAATLGLRAV